MEIMKDFLKEISKLAVELDKSDSTIGGIMILDEMERVYYNHIAGLKLMSTKQERVKTNEEIGEEVFMELYRMPKDEMYNVLRIMCGEETDKDTFENAPLKRELIDEVPTTLVISSYDVITINRRGIQIFNGNVGKSIKFDQCFKLPIYEKL
jgi:hypothetical protein